MTMSFTQVSSTEYDKQEIKRYNNKIYKKKRSEMMFSRLTALPYPHAGGIRRIYDQIYFHENWLNKR